MADGTYLDVTSSMGTVIGASTTQNGTLTRTLLSGDYYGTATISVSELYDGYTVTATQTVGGDESCYSWPVVVNVPAPTVEPMPEPANLNPTQLKFEYPDLLVKDYEHWSVTLNVDKGTSDATS